MFASLKQHREEATATIVLWSCASIRDDDFIWEIADVVRLDPSRSQEWLHEVKVEPIAVRLKLRAPHPLPHRQWGVTNLSDWNGLASDKALRPLLWQLPRPAKPKPSLPQPIPMTREESLGLPPHQGTIMGNWSHFTNKRMRWADRAELEGAVAGGDVEAMLELAESIVRGPEKERGLQLLRQAESVGDLRAYWILGIFDYENRAAWFERGMTLGCAKCLELLAEEQGERGRALVQTFYERFPEADKTPWAMLALARNLWERDRTAEGRRRAALMLFQAHIELCSSDASIHIGDLYLYGLGGVEKDKREAIAWYQAVFETENQYAHRVALFRLHTLGVKPNANQEQIQTALEDPFPKDFWELRR